MGFFPIPVGCYNGPFPFSNRIYARLIADQAVPIGDDDILFDQIVGGIVSPSNGVYTLRAGITYELEAALSIDYGAVNGNAEYQWVDTANAPIGIRNKGNNYAVTHPSKLGPQTMAKSVFTPLVDTDVKVRNTNFNAAGSVLADFSFASIKILSF